MSMFVMEFQSLKKFNSLLFVVNFDYRNDFYVYKPRICVAIHFDFNISQRSTCRVFTFSLIF